MKNILLLLSLLCFFQTYAQFSFTQNLVGAGEIKVMNASQTGVLLVVEAPLSKIRKLNQNLLQEFELTPNGSDVFTDVEENNVGEIFATSTDSYPFSWGQVQVGYLYKFSALGVFINRITVFNFLYEYSNPNATLSLNANSILVNYEYIDDGPDQPYCKMYDFNLNFLQSAGAYPIRNERWLKSFPNNDFLQIGTGNFSESHFLISRMAPNGSFINSATYFGGELEPDLPEWYPADAVQLSSGNYVASVRVLGGANQFWKLDPSLDTLNRQDFFGLPGGSGFTDMFARGTDSLIVMSSSGSNTTIQSMDTLYNIAWSATLNGLGSYQHASAIKINDSTYWLGGTTTNGGANTQIIYALIINSSPATVCTNSISGDTAFCAGSSASLAITTAANAYQWYRNGNLLPLATNQSLTVNQSGIYNCFITNDCGADSLTTGHIVNIYAPISLPFIVANTDTVCGGLPIVFSTPTVTDNYTWTASGFFPATTTDSTRTIVFDNTTPDIVAKSVSVIIYENGCSYSSTASTVYIKPVIEVMVTWESGRVACSGDSLTMSMPDGYLSYHWLQNNGTLQFSTLSNDTTFYQTLTIPETYGESKIIAEGLLQCALSNYFTALGVPKIIYPFGPYYQSSSVRYHFCDSNSNPTPQDYTLAQITAIGGYYTYSALDVFNQCRDTLDTCFFLPYLANNLNEIDLLNNIELYPNPAKEEVTVILSDYSGVNSISLLSISGQVIRKYISENTSSFNLDLKDVSSGVYYVFVQTDQDKSVKKLIKE